MGCDTSQCGACVVHVDGRAVKACTMFAAEAEGAEVLGTVNNRFSRSTRGTTEKMDRVRHGFASLWRGARVPCVPINTATVCCVGALYAL